LSEGGAVDAGISRVINTTMFNNNAQNAGALHTFESSAIVLSTFAGNEATLKSGSVIYGKNVVLFGNIIAGNKQDKISGKIKTDENNVVGSSIKDIFQNIDGGGSVSLSRMPGIVPALMIKNAGPASGKITAGKLDNWERILGITDFFNVDQWRNTRSPDASTDAGAVLYTSENLSGGESQIPVVDISGLISDVHSRKIPKGIHDLAAAAVQKTQPVSSSGKSETSGKTPAVVSPKVSQSSFDEDLDRIIEAILAGEPFDVDDVADVVPAQNIDPSKSGSKDTKNTKNPEKPADTSPGNDGKNEPQPVTAPVKTSGQNKNNPADALVEANVPLSGVYTINPTNSTGGRNFSSIEEAVNCLNSYGTAQSTRFVIAQGTYITEKPLTISNAQHPIVFSADENGAGKTIIRSNGNNRSIVVAVATSVTMEGLVFEGPSGENADGKNIQNGGGISCNTESVLTFVDCIFRYNKNQTGSGVFAKKVLISRCAFYDNVASDGAGIYVGECTAVNSTFYGNKTGVGGGIYAKEKATVVFCTFTQNEAGGRGAAISASNIYLYGSIVSGNKSSGSKEKDVDGILQANYSNILGGLTFNVFAETDTKGVVKLDFNMGTTPVATVKPSGMAAEQISESLFKQWEDELNLEHLLSVDQNGKRRPQNRNAEIGAWEIPDKRAN
jgi:predicted outer membrane repeat protein